MKRITQISKVNFPNQFEKSFLANIKLNYRLDNSIKVYELAKELNLAPLDLVETIKSYGFNVRNHICTLSATDVEKIINCYTRGLTDSQIPVKKVVRKKHITSTNDRKIFENRIIGSIQSAPTMGSKFPELKAEFVARKSEIEAIEKALKFKRDKEDFISDLDQLDLVNIFQKYDFWTILCKGKEYGVTLPQGLVDASNIFKRVSHTKIPNYREDINVNDFPEDRKEQYEIQLKKNTNKEGDRGWHEMIIQQGVSSEIAFDHLCLKRNLSVINLNVDDPWGGDDNLVDNTIYIDVKSKKKIGCKIDTNLNKDYVDEGEIVAFFSCSSRNYSSDVIVCDLVGIFDPRLLPATLLENTKKVHFFNPCLFVDFDGYFKINKIVLPLIQEEVFHFFMNYKIENYFDTIVNYYGADQLLAFDLSKYLPTELHLVLGKIRKCSSEGKLHLTPIILFDWLLEKIMLKDELSQDDIKKYIFPLCVLNTYQKEYLGIMLRVSSVLSKFNCKHSGKSLLDCKITYSKGIIYAQARDDYRSNTLLGYSWFDGRILSIDKDEQCNCGCLIHEGKGKKIGKMSCPYFGKEPTNYIEIY